MIKRMMTLRMGLVFVGLICALAVSAQRHYLPHVHVGGHAGVSLSRQSFYPSVKERMLPGMTMGVSFRYAEERHVGLMAELNLEQRGWRENFEENDVPSALSYQRRLTYFELPVMTHIFFGSRVMKCFINLGPEVGVMIGDKVTANFPYMEAPAIHGFPANRRYEEMQIDISNRIDYGITAGIGLEFVIRRRHSITLEARYYYGLGNIYPSSKKDYFSASRGSSIQVMLGYQWRLK